MAALTPAYLTSDLPVPVPRYSQSGPLPGGRDLLGLRLAGLA
jgi:hypothetical protein